MKRPQRNSDSPTAVAATAPTILTARKSGKTLAGMFLPDQLAWINDDSVRKLWEKSRRIGATYCEAYDATSVRFRATQPRHQDYWLSSADESAGFEFVEYCRFFAKSLFGAVADYFTERVEDPNSKREATAFCIRCPNGHRITAMTSNPRRFRSKGGDVCLDEIAFHDDARGMLAAASPATRWGGTLRLLSSHAGEQSEFAKNADRMRKVVRALGLDPDIDRHVPLAALQAKARELKLLPIWGYHRTTIVDAVEGGLVQVVNRTRGTSWSREEFLRDCREGSPDEESFLQEYMCQPGTDASAWLSYALIEACEHEDCPVVNAGSSGYANGPCYVGVDVGRTRDLTVIWVLERVGDVLWTRERIELYGQPIPDQEAVLAGVMRHYQVLSCRVDKTGLGVGLADYAARNLGGDIQGVHFGSETKQVMAVAVKAAFEDRKVRITANDGALRDDLHSVRKSVTALGTVRFEGERTKGSHADRFWGLALAVGAAAEGQDSGLWVPGNGDPWA